MMNPQIERFFHSVRRGIEANVKAVLKTMEVPTQRDLQNLKKRLDEIKNSELSTLRKKLEEVKNTLSRVERLKPYISAIEAAAKAARRARTAAGSKKAPKRVRKRS
ncbi:MAG TPA: hypothetical protein VI895_05620 [Bdellovibrionota bacterium]|nr:hypothetical protein [Bdellovibrionota bacterium]